MKEEIYNGCYEDIQFTLKSNFDEYAKRVKYKNNPSNEEVLDGIDINIIEKYLRKKKLENLNKLT